MGLPQFTKFSRSLVVLYSLFSSDSSSFGLGKIQTAMLDSPVPLWISAVDLLHNWISLDKSRFDARGCARRTVLGSESRGAVTRIHCDTTLGEIWKIDFKMISTPPKHFSMIREFHLADFLTLANAASWLAAVLFSMLYMSSRSPTYIFVATAMTPVALVFDWLDGRIARWIRWLTSSPSGWLRRHSASPPA